MEEIDYKKKYLELKDEYERIKKIVNSRKEDLVNTAYKKLNIPEDCEIYTTYGYFLWKLSNKELIYLNKIITKEKKNIIRAPAKILVGIRFKNRCKKCKKSIPPNKKLCNKCSKK